MDLLASAGAQLGPKDMAEAIAIFRAQVIGPLLTRVFVSHGELASAIAALSRERHLRPTRDTKQPHGQPVAEVPCARPCQ